MYDNKSMELIKAITSITKTTMNTKLEKKNGMKSQKKNIRICYEKSFTEYLEEIKNSKKSEQIEFKSLDHLNFVKPNFEFNNKLNEVQENLNRILAEKMYNN